VIFSTDQDSHAHSVKTLDLLYEYDDFMGSVGTMCDMGCGSGLDLEWWATRNTRDDNAQPLNITCQGIDTKNNLQIQSKYQNIKFRQGDFEDLSVPTKHKFDVIWCHDAFQYCLNPLATLRQWHGLMNSNAMLILILPQTTNVMASTLAFDQPDYVYYNWTMVSLIHCLAVSGFDCASGYFYKDPSDIWLHAVVYRSEASFFDPKSTRWYHLAEANMLPESAASSANRYGYVRQQDLVLPWLDRSHRWLGE
jgi:SAM-dependent methyltransferase